MNTSGQASFYDNLGRPLSQWNWTSPLTSTAHWDWDVLMDADRLLQIEFNKRLPPTQQTVLLQAWLNMASGSLPRDQTHYKVWHVQHPLVLEHIQQVTDPLLQKAFLYMQGSASLTPEDLPATIYLPWHLQLQALDELHQQHHYESPEYWVMDHMSLFYNLQDALPKNFISILYLAYTNKLAFDNEDLELYEPFMHALALVSAPEWKHFLEEAKQNHLLWEYFLEVSTFEQILPSFATNAVFKPYIFLQSLSDQWCTPEAWLSLTSSDDSLDFQDFTDNTRNIKELL